MKAVAVLLVAVTACSPATRHHVNRAALGVAVLSTVCDWGQTRAAASSMWDSPNKYYFETNPFLGRHPSVRTVDLYMAGSLIAMVAFGQLLPDRLKPLFYGLSILSEGQVIVQNYQASLPRAGACGMQFGGTP